jgi:hypothetical protein
MVAYGWLVSGVDEREKEEPGGIDALVFCGESAFVQLVVVYYVRKQNWCRSPGESFAEK